MRTVCFTIDIEPDCPPYLSTQYRGVTDGLPRLLGALKQRGVPATAFCTGEVALLHPQAVEAVLAHGHELGCHGHTHRRFDQIDRDAARWEIQESTRALRAFGASVTSFRAPNLRFPNAYLPLLEANAFELDSSQARYKADYYAGAGASRLTRIPASMTSSVLRLPSWIRDPWLLALRSPVVLFVHPWEFVDLRHEQLRLDCRFRTGDEALRCVNEVVTLFQSAGARFVPMRDVATRAARAA
jgi:peptidoglycan/xylan/chitin deacetylase (PgdA/CDA1 family)